MLRLRNQFQLFSFILILILSGQSYAESIQKSDIATLHKDINQMYQAFEAGDASLFLEKTHPSIFKLAGGKAKFERSITSAVKQFKKQDIKFIDSTLGIPDELYTAGDQEVCFIPRTSVMEISGNRATSIGFLIAVRDKGGKQWTYLDGSGLRKNQQMLWLLLPDLPKDVKLPANSIEAG